MLIGTNHAESLFRRPRFDVSLRPFIIIWEVTRACDLVCAHCRAEAIPMRNPNELTTAEGRRLIDQVAEIGPPHPLFVLTGGDPMKRPDLNELVKYAAKKALPVALSPSATRLLTAELLAELRECGLKVISLSLDGDCARVHDSFRGVEGVFERTMELWEAARACNLKVQLNTTVVRQNLTALPAIARMAHERNVMTWSVFFMVPTGRASALSPLDPDECEDVMHFLYDVAGVVRVKATEGHHFRRVVIQRSILERHGVRAESAIKLGPLYRSLSLALEPWPRTSATHIRRSPMDVNAGRGFVFISHTGAVHPSGFLPLAAGNVRERSLLEIYRESPLFVHMRDGGMLKGRCGVCEFGAVCGGSRSRALATTGNPLAEDPLCAYQPGSFPYQGEVARILARAP
jgi:radical SAM protein